MAVPYTFATASTSIPLSQLDANFLTPITLGTTTVYLGNTVTSLANISFSNITINSVLTQFPNSYLANSAVTIGNTSVSLGSTVTSVGNLTLANVTITGSSITANTVTGGATNQILVQTAANTTGFVSAPATANTFLQWTGSTFAWATGGTSGVSSLTAGSGIAVSASTGAVTVSQAAPAYNAVGSYALSEVATTSTSTPFAAGSTYSASAANISGGSGTWRCMGVGGNGQPVPIPCAGNYYYWTCLFVRTV